MLQAANAVYQAEDTMFHVSRGDGTAATDIGVHHYSSWQRQTHDGNTFKEHLLSLER